jgi:hypothetical protein
MPPDPVNNPPRSPAAAGPREYPVVPESKPDAIVVHCSDPRFQAAFDQFIGSELGLARGKFIPMVIGGGAGVLSHPEQLPKEFKFLKERFEHYRQSFPSIRRVVLINHEDCRYYGALKEKVMSFLGPRLPVSLAPAREDLPLISRVFNRLLSHLGVTVELYYAKFSDAAHTRIVFEKIAS